MLRFSPAALALEPSLRYGLDVLVDQSRVLVVDDPSADVVTLDIDPTLGASGFRVSEGKVIVTTGALGWVQRVAGAEAEARSSARDRYGRVPSTANPVVMDNNSERRPSITEAAVRLRQRVHEAAGRRCVRVLAPWPDGKRWAAALTHDVDVVTGWPAFTALRLVELFRKGELGRAGRVIAAALGAIGGDPTWRGMADVLSVERDVGVVSTWFLLCGTPTMSTWRAGDLTYSPESRAVKRLLDALAAAGHEVGLHGSFATYDNAEVFGEQRRRLSALGATPTGVRQHYLRMVPGATQTAMRAAGFAYDATFGFPDRNGFRLGSADIVPSSFVEGLDEVPLVWMDRALSKYRGIEDPNAWVDDALELAAAARAVEGLWVGLWHCNLTAPLGYPGAPAAYARLLTEITRESPYVATLDRLVAWRRARRAVRATAVAPDGRCSLSTPWDLEAVV
ncbi:MAG TPA: hypothetical protein VK807_21770 [Gemmatimonadaceae bacterium]|jgi:hypothetical protein|nr:hypothetical protein [Gemmatimonadaceae bacterium]